MKKDKCLGAKLRLLEPDEGTICSYKEIESKSIDRLKEFLDGINGEKYNKTATQVLSAINKLRSTMKSQMAVRIQVFKNISKDKKELQMYIKATMPDLVRKSKL